MSAHEAGEALYQGLAARLVSDDALRERVATVARAMGIPATTLLLDLRADAWGIA